MHLSKITLKKQNQKQKAKVSQPPATLYSKEEQYPAGHLIVDLTCIFRGALNTQFYILCKSL